eukprot:TRINITY_DN4512_c0_g1_i1.p3 TRINITY_DN4512_c0_g1~~TRINITY_DN4512_c0_g1_i1.p3  ORF type:complete len:56 (-),score=23.09 TRINITY_DN4512_c0_g1_i1:4-171(-)
MQLISFHKMDFLQAVLPDGMEPHHINLQEPYQLFMEQPTVAPTGRSSETAKAHRG